MANKDINTQLTNSFGKNLLTEYLDKYKNDLEITRANLWLSDLDNLNGKLKKIHSPFKATIVKQADGMPVINNYGLPEIVIMAGKKQVVCRGFDGMIKSPFLSPTEKAEIEQYLVFAEQHTESTEKLYTIATDALKQGKFDEEAVRKELDPIFTGTGSSRKGTLEEARTAIINASVKRLQTFQQDYEKAQTNYIKAQTRAGEVAPFTSKMSKIDSRFSNSKVKSNKTVGVTSINSKADTFILNDNLNIDNMPKMPTKTYVQQAQTKRLNTQLSIQRSSLPSAQNTRKVFYDTETFGDLGNKNFGVAQYTFRWGKGADQQYSAIVKQEKETAKLIQDTVSKLERGEKLSAVEERTAKWLLDYDFEVSDQKAKNGKQIATITTSHNRRNAYNIYSDEILNQIKKGAIALTSDNYEFTNRTTNAKVLKELQRLKIVNGNQISSNNLLIGQNNENFDDRVLKQALGITVKDRSFDMLTYIKENYQHGTIRKGKNGAKVLLGYQNEELADFFDIDLKKAAEEWYKTYKPGEEFTDKVYEGLQHLSDWDTIITEEVYKAAQKDAQAKAAKLGKQGKLSTVISQGDKAVAMRSEDRRNQADYLTDSNDNNKLMDGKTNKYDNRLFRSGAIYSFRGTKKIGDNLYEAVYHDEERNIDVHVSGTKQELAKRNKQTFGVDSWKSASEFDRLYSTKDRAINQIFDDFYGLKQQVGLAEGKITKTGAKHSGRYAVAKSFVDANKEDLSKIVKAIDKENLTTLQKNMAVKMIAQKTGLYSLKGLTPSEMHNYITANVDNKFNSYINAYKTFMKEYEWVFQATKEGREYYKDINQAIGILSRNGSEQMLDTQGNLFYGLGKYISEGLQQFLPTGQGIAQHKVAFNTNNIEKIIDNTLITIKKTFNNKGEISHQLYENAKDNGRLRQNLDGRIDYKRRSNSHLSFNRQLNTEEKDLTLNKNGKLKFGSGSLGQKINRLQSIVKKRGIAMTVVPSQDESNLSFYFYDERRANDVLRVQNGEITVNSDRASSFVLPLVSDQGVMNYNGMNVVNTFNVDTEKGKAGELHFSLTTTQDKIMNNLIRQFEKTPPEDATEANDPTRKLTVSELIKNGETKSAERSMNFLKKLMIEGSASIDTYKQMEEANDQIKESGSLQEKYIRAHTIDVKDTLEHLFKAVTGQDINEATFGDKTIFGPDIFNTMISHLIESNRGHRTTFRGELTNLFGEGEEGSTNYGEQIEAYIEKIADILPTIDLTPSKETAITTAGRLVFTSSRNFRAFSSLNSEMKRRPDQVYHTLEKTAEAKDLNSKIAEKVLENIFGQKPSSQQSYENKYRRRMIESDQLPDFLRFANISEENYLDRGENYQYNIKGINDLKIKEAVEQELSFLEEKKANNNGKLDTGDAKYYKQLKTLAKDLPSVYEGTILTRQSESGMFSSLRTNVSKELDLRDITDDFLELISGATPSQEINRNTLAQLLGEEGGTIDLSGTNITKSIMAMGKSPQERQALKLKVGDRLQRIVTQNGKLRLIYDQSQQMKSGSRMLLDAYAATTNVSIPDRLFEAIVGNDSGKRSDIDILQENSAIKSTRMSEQVGGRYEYLFDLLHKLGYGNEEIAKALETTNGAKQYIKYKNGGFVTVGKKEKGTDGQFYFVDDRGKLILQNKEEVKAFTNPFKEEQDWNKVKSFEDLKIDKNSDIGRILDYFGYFGKTKKGKVLRDLYDPFILRMGANLANEYEYTGAIGIGSQDFYDLNSRHKIGTKEAESIFRSVADAEEEASPEKYVAFSNLRDKLTEFAYGDEAKIDANGNITLDKSKKRKLLEERSSRILNSLNATLKKVSLGKLKSVDFEDFSRQGWADLVFNEGGGVDEDVWESTAYGKLLKKAGKNKYLSIKFGENLKNLFATGSNQDERVLNELVIAMFDPDKMGKNQYVVSDYVKKVNSVLSAIQKFEQGTINQDTVQEYLNTFLQQGFRDVAHKHGNLYEQLHTTRKGSGLLGTVEGLNVAGYNESMENNILIGENTLRTMLGINFNPNTKQYGKALDKLRFQYGSLMNFKNEGQLEKAITKELRKRLEKNYRKISGLSSKVGLDNKTLQELDEKAEKLYNKEYDGLSKEEQTLEEEIIKDLTVKALDMEQGGKTLPFYFNRYPSTNMLSMRAVNVRVNKQIKDNYMKVAPGLEVFVNADHDADKGYLVNPLLNATAKDYEDYKEAYSQMNKVVSTQTKALQELGGEKIADIMKGFEGSAEDIYNAYSEIYDFYTPQGIANDDLASLVAKINFSKIGTFSNLHTSIRSLLDAGNLGNRSQNPKTLTASTFVAHFLEFLEQDAISAKKIGDRLKFTNHEGKVIDNDKFNDEQKSYDERRRAVFHTLDSIKSLISQPLYRISKVAADKGMSAAEYKWTQVIDKMLEEGMLTEKNGVIWGKGKRHFDMAFSTLSRRKIKGKEITFDNPELLSAQGLSKQGLIQQFVTMEEEFSKAFNTGGSSDFVTYARTYFNEGQRDVTPKDIVKRLREYNEGLQEGRYGRRRQQLLDQYHIETKNNKIVLDDKGLPVIKGIQQPKEIGFTSFLAQLVDPDGAHEYVTDSSYQNSLSELIKMYEEKGEGSADAINAHVLNKGKARIGKIFTENEKGIDKGKIVSVTSLIDKIIYPYGYKSDELDEIAKAAIEASGDLKENQDWTSWNSNSDQRLVQYANAMNNDKNSALLGKVMSQFQPVNRGRLQHAIFDQLNKKIHAGSGKDKVEITQKDIEEIFNSSEIKTDIEKLNLQGKKLGLKSNVINEEELKAVTQAYANYLKNNDISDTLASETSLGFTIDIGGKKLNLVGTADMITATGVKDFKYKGQVHGKLESWQLSLLNKMVLSEIERSYAVDKAKNTGMKKALAQGFSLGTTKREEDYLTEKEYERLKNINGVFEQGVLQRYSEKKGKKWYAKKGSRAGFSKEFYNMIMNPQNYKNRKIAPELIIEQLGSTKDATGKTVGWIKELSFDQISDNSLSAILNLYMQMQATDNTQKNIKAKEIQTVLENEENRGKYNTLRETRLFGPNGLLTKSLDGIKQSLGLEGLNEEERGKKLWDILKNGTSTNKRSLLSDPEFMARFGLKAINPDMDARTKEFRDVVALVQNIGDYGEENIPASNVLEKYRLEGAKFGTDFIEHAKVESAIDLDSYSDTLSSEYKPAEVLRAFMKMDKDKKPEELRERAAFFGSKGTYLEGSAFTGEKSFIDLQKMSDNYLFDENGKPKENVDKSDIYSLLHTHTSGGVLPSIQDIEAMETFAKDGYDNLKILQVGDNLGRLLSLDLSNIADYDNFIENYRTWLDSLKKDFGEKLPKGALEEKDGHVVGVKEVEGFSLFDSDTGRVITESLFNQMGKLLGSDNFTVTNSEGKLLQLAHSKGNGEQEDLQFKIVTNSKGKSLWAPQGTKTVEAVLAGNEEITKKVEEGQKELNSIKELEETGEKSVENSQKFADHVHKLVDIYSEMSETAKDKAEEKFEFNEDNKQLVHKTGEKAGQAVTAEDINNFVEETKKDVATKIVNETLNTEVKEAENTSGGFTLVDTEGKKVKLKSLYSQLQKAIQQNNLSEIGRLNEEYKDARADYAHSYAAVTGITYRDYSAEKDIKKEYEAEQKAANSKIQEIIGQYESLNSMLQQNVPTNYLTSMLKDLQVNLATLEKMDKSFEDIYNSMGEEKKAKLIKDNIDNYNNLLTQDRHLDYNRYGLEQTLTNEHVFGADTQKQFILNPYRNRIMTEKAHMLDLETAGVQANLSLQEDIARTTGDTNLAKQYEERKKFNEEYKKTNRLYLETAKNAQKGSIALEHLAGQTKGMLKTAMEYGVVYRGAQALISQIYTIIGSIKEFDTLETQLRLTKSMNKETAASMIKDYKNIANELGTTTQAVTASAVTFLRQGRSVKDTNNLIRQSAILAKVGFMEEKNSAELLTATLNGFKMEAKEAASVVDLVAYTDTIAATSAQELMTAFQYVASSASVAGIEVEKLNAMIATSSEVTRLSASTIGQAYKTMISRLQQVKVGSLVDSESGEDLSNVDKMLKQYGINIMDNNNKMKEGDQILEEFAKKWKSWGSDTAKKREAIEALAGTRQGNIAMSLFDNWDRYEEILADTEKNAEGSASEKMRTSTESINSSIARLQNTLKDFASSSGAVGVYKWVIDLTNGFATMGKVLGPLALLYVVLGKNGAGLNAIYNVQIGLVNKLKTSFQSLLMKQELQKKQALESLNNANTKTISGAGITAFIDPTTGKISEPVDNSLAARTLAFNAENNFHKNIEKLENANVLKAPVGEEAIKQRDGLRAEALKGQIAIQRARVNGTLENGSVFAENLKRWTDEAVVSGSMTEAERNQIYANAGKLADMGKLDNKALNKYLLGKDEKGRTISKVTDENTAELAKNHKEYLEKYPEALANQEEALVQTMSNLINAIQENTAAIRGEKGGNSKPKTKSGEIKEQLTQKDENGNYVKQGEEKASLWAQYNAEEDKEKLAQNNTKGKEKYLLEKRQERRQKRIENGIPPKEQSSTTNTPFIATQEPTSSKNQSGFNQFYEKHKQGIVSGAGIIGLTGGSMLGTILADRAGASDSMSSMIGMGTGMAMQALPALFGPGGAIASVAIGGAGFIAKAIKDHNEKIKENIRQTFNEAQEGFNNANKQLREISDSDFQKLFRELSQGVGKFGENVSLTKEQYEKYQEMVKKLTDGHEELIKTTDEEGNVYAEKNELLQRSIELLKEQVALEKERMYTRKSTKQQLEDNLDEREELWKNSGNIKVSTESLKALVRGGKAKGVSVEWLENFLKSGKSASEINSVDNWRTKLRDLSQRTGTALYPQGEGPGGYSQVSSDFIVENIISAIENKTSTMSDYNKLQAQAHSILKGYISTQDYYKNATQEEKIIYDKMVDKMNVTDQKGDIDKLLTEANISVGSVANSSAKGSILEYFRGSKNSQQKVGMRKALFKTLSKAMGGAEKAYDFLQNIGVIESKAKYSDVSNNIDNALSFDSNIHAIKQKIDRDDTLSKGQKSNLKTQLEAFDENTLKDINNNYDKLVFDPFKNGIVSLKEAVAKWKKDTTDIVLEQINTTQLTKDMGVFSKLRDLVSEYRNNPFKNSKGQYELVVTPEQQAIIEEIRNTLGLTKEEVSKALSDGQGGIALGEDNVGRLAYIGLQKSLADKDFTLETLESYDRNLRALGINSGKTVGFKEYATYLMKQGLGEISNGQLVARNGKNFTPEQEKMVGAINNSGILKNQANVNYLNHINELYNIDDFLGKLDDSKVDFDYLSSAIRDTINSLGGMQGVLNSLVNSGLYSQENLPSLFNKMSEKSPTNLANYVRNMVPSLASATDEEVKSFTLQGLETFKAQKEAELAVLESGDTGISEEYEKGLKEKRGEEEKALRNAKRSLHDLKKEAELDKINTDIQKVQNSFDKLAKSIQTCATAMELLDAQDFSSKFELINNQIEYTNEYTQGLEKEWSRLLEQYNSANTGEAKQAIGEQLSKVSDQLTENAKQRVELQKQLSQAYLNRFETELSNAENTFNRQKNFGDLQKSLTGSKEISYINTSVLLNPNNFLSNFSKDDLQKERDLTRKLIEEENSRQKKLLEIKQEYQEQIYAENSKRRAEDITDAEEEVEKLGLKVENLSSQLSGNIQKQMIEDLKSLISQINEILSNTKFDPVTLEYELRGKEGALDYPNLTLKENSKRGELLTQIEEARTSKNKIGIGIINELSKIEAKGKGYNIIEAQNHRMNNLNKYNNIIQGGAKVGHRLYGSDLLKDNGITTKNNLETYTGQGGLIFKEPDKKHPQGQLAFVEKEDIAGKATVILDDGTKKEIDVRSASGWKHVIEQSNAYATSQTPIAKGPITVAEKEPEFVMFKNGTGMIFDKTTVLNGADVDFVSNASYAKNGKNNGTPVAGSYANGGGKDNTEKTVQKKAENIHNNIVNTAVEVDENIDETNKNISKNVFENNTEIEKTIEKSWDKNNQNVNDSLWDLKQMTKSSLIEVENIIGDFLEGISSKASGLGHDPYGSYQGDVTDKFDDILRSASKEFGVPFGLLKAVMDVESKGNRTALSGKGATGLMQLLPSTFAGLNKGLTKAEFTNIYDPTQNIRAGAKYLSQKYNEYGSWDKALGFYNGGVKGASSSPYAETVAYIQKVFSLLSGYGGDEGVNTNAHKVTSGYNVSRNIMGKTGTHKGIDLAYNYEPIYANKDLTITEAGWVSGFGKAIYAQDNEGYTYIFGHLNSINVKAGQKVKAGTKLGVTGNTGRSTGPHLHYQVQKNGSTINPNSKTYAFRNSGGIGGDENGSSDKIETSTQNTTVKEDLVEFLSKEYKETQVRFNQYVESMQATVKDIATKDTGLLESAATYAKDLKEASVENSYISNLKAYANLGNTYDEKIKKINEEFKKAIEEGSNDSKSIEDWYKSYDELVNKINELNEQISKEVETMVNNFKEGVEYAFSYMDSIQAKVEKTLEEINVQFNNLRDYQTIEKSTLALEKFHLAIQKWNVNANQLTAYDTQIQNKRSDVVKSFEALGLSPLKVNSLMSKLSNLVRDDGTTDNATMQDLKKLAENLSVEQGNLLPSEQNLKILSDLQASLQELSYLGEESNKAEKERLSLDQERNSALWDMVTQNEAYNKQAKEERYSIYNAIVNNSEYLKELVNMQGQLIKDTEVKDKTTNKIEEYGRLMDVVRSQLKLHDAQTTDVDDLLYKFNEQYGITGITANNWYDSQGNLIAQVFNRDKAYLEKLYKGETIDRSDKIGTSFEGNNKDVGLSTAQIGAILSSMEVLGNVSQERTETLKNISSSMSEAISMQKDILEYQKELMTTFKAELLSAIGANSDRNSLVSGYLDKLYGVFDTFNRNQKLTMANAQLQTNKTERENLLDKNSLLLQQIQKAKTDIYKITDEIDINSLFTAKGERRADTYNEAQATLDKLVEDGTITIGQQMTIKNNLDMMEENLKDQVQTNEDIISNYNTENELISKKIELQAEAYDWEIKKMEALLSLKEKQFDTENKILSLRSDLDKELRSAKQQTEWLSKSERLRIFNEEDYAQLYKAIDEMENKSSAYFEDYYSQMMNLTEDTLYKQEYITSEYQRRMELVEAEYNLTQKRVDLEKQQLKLKNVVSEKNTRMYINGEWRHVANTEDVINSSEALSDAETAYKQAKQEKLQKIQSAQMSKYIDGLKEVQAALQNSTKYTNNTEEELAQYVSQLISALTGGDLDTSSVKMTIDNLNTSIFDFTQTFDTEVNGDLMKSIRKIQETLSNEFDSDYLKEVNDKLKEALNETTLQTRDMNKELRTSTQTLGETLDELVNVLQAKINSLTMEVSYDQNAYKDINDIVNAKMEYENADKQLQEKRQELESTSDAQRKEQLQKDINNLENYQQNQSKKADEKRTSLIKNGYSKYANFLGADNTNWETAEAFRAELENTNQKYWEQVLQKYSDENQKLSEKNVEYAEWMDTNIEKQTENTQNDSYNTEVEGNNVTVFKDGVEQWKGTITEEGELIDEYGSHINKNGTYVNSFGEYVNDIPEQFKEVAISLSEAIKNGSISTSEEKKNYNYSGGSWTQISNNRFVSSNSSANSAYAKNAAYTASLKSKNSKTKKAAKGDISTTNDLYNIDEQGSELYIPSGRLKQMEYGDQVVPHDISENLLKWGTVNPYLMNSIIPEHNSTINNTQTTNINIEQIQLNDVQHPQEFVTELNRYLQRTNSLTKY